MSTVTASLLCANAGPLGLPAGKTNLLALMRRRGIPEVRQRVAGGQPGVAFEVARLWPELRLAVEALLSPAEPEASALDFATFARAPLRARQKAEKRLKHMELVKAEIDAGLSVSAAVEKVAAALADKVSTETLEREWRRVKALPWHDWRASLLPGWKPRKAAPIRQEVWDLWFTLYARQSEPSAQQTYEEIAKAAKAHAWGKLPSLRTFQRRWDALPAAVKTAARKGEKAADRRHTPPGDLDKSGTPIYEHFTVDSRRFDTHSVSSIGLDVEVVDGERRFRPMVAAAIEGVTSYCLHVEVMGDTEHTVLYRRLLTTTFDIHGLCDWVLFDSTMAAANKDITGGAKVRYRWTREHDEAAGMLKRCNIEPRFSKPGQPWGKIVERFWLDIKDRVEKDPELEGSFLGKDTVSKPGNYGERAVPFNVFKRVLGKRSAEPTLRGAAY